AYEGKALVNSVTGEDERLEAILPIVARHGAAVIGLANAEDIPMEPERRLEVAKKIVSVAGDYGIPPEDVLIDPLAMPVGAEPRAVTLFVETLHLLRDELGVNTTCGAGNTSFGLPGRHTLGAAFHAVAIDSTCGGHGTCKKCKVKVVSGHAPLSAVDPRAFTVEELKNGWRLACRAAVQEDLTIEVPPLQTRPKAALVGVGRHVILR